MDRTPRGSVSAITSRQIAAASKLQKQVVGAETVAETKALPIAAELPKPVMADEAITPDAAVRKRFAAEEFAARNQFVTVEFGPGLPEHGRPVTLDAGAKNGAAAPVAR